MIQGDKQIHSLLERIALIIESPERILYKMQSVDKFFKMYGDGEGDREGMEVGEDGNGNDDGSDLRFEKYRKETEVFNDSQFYRRMLKEIIDIGHATSVNSEEINRKMDKLHEKKKEKIAFRKAKLRMKFAIRPDMVNFMAPIYDHDADFPFQPLYKSLFQ